MRLPLTRFSLLLLPLLVAALLLGACDDSITDPGDDGPTPQPDPVEDSLAEIAGVWAQTEPDEPRFLIIEEDAFTEIFFTSADCFVISENEVVGVEGSVFTIQLSNGNTREISFATSSTSDVISLTRRDNDTTFLFEPSDREPDSFTPVCDN
ncbi:MAG: hypothetical protein GVY12_11660 [Bacteroidetes bacterium]|jgi:hypothetical protein|nr:hypothetical protein [Bacteroidota bacterium]